jgi:hypothetical protein
MRGRPLSTLSHSRCRRCGYAVERNHALHEDCRAEEERAERLRRFRTFDQDVLRRHACHPSRPAEQRTAMRVLAERRLWEVTSEART